MPHPIPRPCSTPGCPNPATTRGRCPDHAREDEAVRNARRAISRRVYNSTKWRKLRASKLKTDPFCECDECNARPPGGADEATDVDHRVPIEDGGDPWAWENLQSLSHPHHSRKTRADVDARATGGRMGGRGVAIATRRRTKTAG